MPHERATMIGRLLGHHRILEKIGAGGMGEVYRAHDERLDRDVALKVLHTRALADDTARRRFRREALALSRLNHPNVETVHEFDTEGGVDFLVMECVDGETLTDKLAHGPLAETELLRLAGHLAEGLTAAHDRGVVHRDLKPDNLRVTSEGRLKILDFGLATLRASDAALGSATTHSLTDTQSIAGTVPYMAPEQLRGEGADHRCDIWAVGVILYEMATGRRPFEAKLVTALAADIQTKPPTPPRQIHPRVAPELEQIILKCLEKDPALRYQTVGDLLVDIRRFAARQSGETKTALVGTRRRIRIRGWLGIALVAIAAGPLIYLAVDKTRQRSAAPAVSPPEITSLAVLPLTNRSTEPDQDYLVEGLHEAIITELSQIRALRVISRTSTMRFRGDSRLDQVAKDLNVDAVVEGSVWRLGNRLRVSVRLTRLEPEGQLWADSFDRELTDVLFLTNDVANAVSRKIRVVLTPAEKAKLGRPRRVNPDAYALYALGRHHWNQRTMEGYRQAIETFRKALRFDENYAPVYAALADAYLLLGEQGGLPQKEAGTQADMAIRRALELDPNLPEALATLGQWRFSFEWNWSGSDEAFRRAIELNPGYAPAHQLYGRTLAFIGRFDEALAELGRAKQLDPLSIIINAYIGQVHLFAGDYDRAAEQLRWTLALNPNHALTLHNLGELHLAQGQFGEAITQLSKAVGVSREPSAHYLAMLGCAYANGNRQQDALEILEELTRRSERGLVSAFDLASLHLALGDRKRSLEWLERGYEQRDYWLAEIKAWPWFDSLRREARFQTVLRRMNFPAGARGLPRSPKNVSGED